VEILSAIAIASIIWFAAWSAQIVTLGVLVAFMQYAQRFFRPIQDLSEKYNILHRRWQPVSAFSSCWIRPWM